MVENITRLQVDTIIDKNVNVFLKRVKDISELGPFEKSRKVTPGFPILKPANSEYYKYKYFETFLEGCIREHLATVVFAELFELYGIISTWPPKKPVDIRSSNEAIEDVYPFEFIVHHNGKNIGYRFTSLNIEDNQLVELLKKYSIELIDTIDWSEIDTPKSDRTILNISEKYRKHISYISLRDFFTEYFSEEVFSIYISKARLAVEKANYEIGFQTIPQLSPRFLSKFREEVLLSLLEADFRNMKYQKKGKKGSYNGDGIALEDYIIIDNNFKGKGLYRALVSDEDFAKCFITSEYMYQIFKVGNNFDYTSVVSGYIKCIEQLLYKIMKIALVFNNSDKLWIKAKKHVKDNLNYRFNPAEPWKKVSQVKFNTNYEWNFDIALSPLIWFLHDITEGWYISEQGKDIIHGYLLDYAEYDRNQHFHKDNIYDFNVVDRIRNNTIVLIYLIIGGCVLTRSKEHDFRIMGIIDDSYDRLYKKLKEIPRSIRNFYLEFESGLEIKAIRKYLQIDPIYNNNGVIQSDIHFIKVDDFQIEYDEQLKLDIPKGNKLNISRNNLPQKVWYVKRGGERVLIEW